MPTTKKWPEVATFAKFITKGLACSNPGVHAGSPARVTSPEVARLASGMLRSSIV